MRPELRLIDYFVAVADARNVTRAAERLHISQPSLSAAIRQLEAQLGVALLHRKGRRITLTEAGELLAHRGRELLAQVDALTNEITGRAAATSGRIRLGASPTARHGVLPMLLAACADAAPAVMIYTTEDTSGALLRDVARGALEAAVTFCAASPPPGVVLHPLVTEAAVVHLPGDHPLAIRQEIALEDLARETILIAASQDSAGFTDHILSAFATAGLHPKTRPDPYPDLGRQAVRERLGIVIYARGAFPPQLPGSAFVPLHPPVELPFQLAVRRSTASTPVSVLTRIATSLQDQPQPFSHSGLPEVGRSWEENLGRKSLFGGGELD